MKKIGILLMVLGLMLLPHAISAQGIESGDSLFSIYGGVGTALEKSGMEINGNELSWGNIGGELGLSYLYFPSAYLGAGLNLRYAGFQGTSEVNYFPGYWHWHTLESKYKTDSFQLMVAGRINLNPHAHVRVYFPFGGGLGVTAATMTYTWDARYEEKESATRSSFAWYGGIGIEFSLNDKTAWSIEARYNTFRYDNNSLARHIGAVTSSKEAQRSYVSLAVSLSF